MHERRSSGQPPAATRATPAIGPAGGRIRLGISSCLLGNEVRYNGGHQLDRFLRDELGAHVEWVPVCPEVECGLPIPRESMRLVGDPQRPRLVTGRSGVDHTERMLTWAARRLDQLAGEGLYGFVFKHGSPSSGMERIKVYDAHGMPSKGGVGLFAAAFMARFPLLPVEDDGRLNDARLRDNFIERIFTLQRWRAWVDREDQGLDGGQGAAARHGAGPVPEAGPGLARSTGARWLRRALVDFHARHKLLLMSHSPAALTQLGQLVANAKDHAPAALRARYLELLMPCIKQIATVRKHTNVLQHAAGYFKRSLDAADRVELAEAIAAYHAEQVPLVVPLTLLKHHVRRQGPPYLAEQVYLDPHPAELRLRNRV